MSKIAAVMVRVGENLFAEGPAVDGASTLLLPCNCCEEYSPVNREFVEYLKLKNFACAACTARYNEGQRWNGTQWIMPPKKEIISPEMRTWLEICPPLYQETKLDHPNFPKTLYQKQLAKWVCGSRSLVLHGDTGTAKSRCMFLLLHRLIFADKKRVKVFFPEDWSIWVAANCKGDEDALYARRELMAYDVIAFDDLFVEKLTDRAEGQLQSLIDQRVREMKPVIATTMYTGKDLQDMGKFIDSKRGQAVLRRLRESGLCDAIPFIRQSV